MKNITIRCLHLLLCLCVAIPAVADGSRLTRDQIKEARSLGSPVTKLRTPHGHNGATAVAPPVRGFNPTTGGLPRKSPRRAGVDDLLGTRILMADVYDFDWDNSLQVATVIDSTFFMMGRVSSLSRPLIYPANDVLLIGDLFDTFGIPISVNGDTVTLKAGVSLASRTYTQNTGGEEPYIASRQTGTDVFKTVWTVYAMPESWLTGDDDYGDIMGSVLDDGTIVIDEGFGLLIREVRYLNGLLVGTVSWGLSPIYRNLKMLVPNGVHEYYGAPFESVGPTVVNDDFKRRLEQGFGHGGVVSRPISPRPVLPKPVTPRPFNPGLGKHLAVAGRLAHGGGSAALAPLRGGEHDIFTPVLYQKPVYMYLADDTTLMVFNLFGRNYSWNYLTLHPGGSVLLPSQVIDQVNGQQDIYNCSMEGDSLVVNNLCAWSADTITWGTTYSVNLASGVLLGRRYEDNKLYFTTGMPHEIVSATFNEPVVTDTAVSFSLSVIPDAAATAITVYYPETDEYQDVMSPWTAPRRESSYVVWLEAFVVVEDNGDVTWVQTDFMDYEVPALVAQRGDVNRDGAVDVSDVTTLVTLVLNGAGEGWDYDTMDCNQDGAVDVGDVTSLIAHVLGNN